MKLRMGSVCSGMEAATVAMKPLGWSTEFVAEIEPFPCHVLAERHGASRPLFMPDPDEAEDRADKLARAAAIKAVAGLPERGRIPNFGDLNRVEDWPDATIDVLIGGTPCQDFSIAGLGKGLDGERGQLSLKYAVAARRYRPRWLVWENVVGVLSNNSGQAFASLLGLLSGNRIEIPPGGWQTAGVVPGLDNAYGLAWRVLDAQFVRIHGLGRAVPQRRRRVFVIGYLGDWRRAAAVLFERESLSGNSPPRRQSGKDVAPTLSARTKGGGGLGTDFDHDGGLVAHALRAEGFDASEDGTGRGTPLVPVALNDLEGVSHALRAKAAGMGQIDPFGETFVQDGAHVEAVVMAHGQGGAEIAFDRCPTLTCDHEAPILAQGVALRGRDGGATAELTGDIMTSLRTGGGGGDKPHVLTAVCFDETQITSKDNRCNPQPGDPSHPLAAGGRPPTLAFHARQDPDSGPVTHPLDTDGSSIGVFSNWRVRRLTPAECLRLQGFPDGYLDIIYRGKPAADGPKYKIIGNSKAINCVRWLGTRIEMVDAITNEVAA